ncbi:hypothetical protein [Bacillus sp. FJAT-29814]|uniref:hypothetical protein n=1 Tax=Bacillus sp. FJAT-29814 TaxID=1729688 RepID=UPI00082E5DC3|nr:hypothetical protein [Bacillus sp. FJAT-29814]
MNVVEIYLNSFIERLNYITSQDLKSEHEKYLEVCVNYANIVSALSKNHGHLKLLDLKPITKVLEDYQNKYFYG